MRRRLYKKVKRYVRSRRRTGASRRQRVPGRAIKVGYRL